MPSFGSLLVAHLTAQHWTLSGTLHFWRLVHMHVKTIKMSKCVYKGWSIKSSMESKKRENIRFHTPGWGWGTAIWGRIYTVLNLADSPVCACGQGIEDADHYFKDCITHNDARRKVRQKFKIDLRQHETEELLEGDTEMTDMENQLVFQAVQWFIRESGRFRWVRQAPHTICLKHLQLT